MPSLVDALVLAVALAAAAIVFWAHAGYPAVLALCAGVARRRRSAAPAPAPLADEALPFVSILVAAWNEEEVIGAKVDDALAQDYPADKLEVIVASDGSDDRTNEIVASRLGPRVRLVALARRGGKARAIRHAAAIARGEVFVLTDANAFFEKDAVRKLVERLREPVGVAFGDVRIRSEGSCYGASEGLFYELERRIQLDESELDSAVGVDGALYAIRRDVFVAPPEGAVLDDLEVAVEAVRRGSRVVYEPRAVGWEDATPTLAQEVRRKSRIVAGAIQAMRAGRLRPPARRGWFLFAWIGHKLARWAAAPALVALLLASAWLAATLGDSFIIIFAAQALFWVVAFAGLAVIERRELGRLSIPVYFLAMHGASLIGLAKGLRGAQKVTWKRADRRPVAGVAPGGA